MEGMNHGTSEFEVRGIIEDASAKNRRHSFPAVDGEITTVAHDHLFPSYPCSEIDRPYDAKIRHKILCTGPYFGARMCEAGDWEA